MRLFHLVISLILFWSCTAAAQDHVSFATTEWEPYSGENLPGYGVGSAIIAEACSRVGIKPTFHFMPWKRAMDDVRIGKYDALYSAYGSRDRSKTYAISKPYISGQLVLCAKRGTNIHWDGSIRSLTPYRIGVVLGFVNTPEFDNAKYLDKDVGPSDLLNLNKLLNGRIDLVVIDLYQALYLIKNSPVLQGSLADIYFLQPPLSRKNIHVMFSKALPNWKKNLELFNKGLESIEKDGTKNHIMAKYGYLPPMPPDQQPDN